MSEQKILVIGSSNTDMVIRTGHLPLPGETVIGGTFFMNPAARGPIRPSLSPVWAAG